MKSARNLLPFLTFSWLTLVGAQELTALQAIAAKNLTYRYCDGQYSRRRNPFIASSLVCPICLDPIGSSPAPPPCGCQTEWDFSPQKLFPPGTELNYGCSKTPTGPPQFLNTAGAGISYTLHANKHCYGSPNPSVNTNTGAVTHGAYNLGNGFNANIIQCQQQCTDDAACACITHQTATNTCYKRGGCNPTLCGERVRE